MELTQQDTELNYKRIHSFLQGSKRFNDVIRETKTDQTMTDRDGSGQVQSMINVLSGMGGGFFNEVAETMKKMQHQLDFMRFRSLVDELTTCWNRRFLNEFMDSFKKQNDFESLFFLDFDHFKQINDTFGHAVGDELLVQFSERVRKTLNLGVDIGQLNLFQEQINKHSRIQDSFLARYGGDEFVIYHKGLFRNQTHNVLAVLQSALGKSYNTSAGPINLNVSIGHSMIETNDIGQYFQTSDVLMYAAKEENKKLRLLN